MAWTNWGFDGTINEAQWAQMAGLLGNGYVAAGNGDCVVTAVGGARSVSVAAGTLYGDGVVSVNSGAETVAMTTPVNGQWYVIALRRTWATNTAALVAIAGATTTTTTPTAPPTSFPTLNTNTGVLTDQPIAWAWCNSANTTVVVYDIRLKAVKSMPPVVANQNERDAKFMTPTQGLQVWRDDVGAVETYYGLYNSSTNPGGRDSAGWYTNGRSGGLIPIKPASVTVTSGTASVTSLGLASFSAATSVIMGNVFTTEYRRYRVIMETTGGSVAPENLAFRFTNGGTPNNSASYNVDFIYHIGGQAISASSQTGVTYCQVGTYYGGASQYTLDIARPALSEQTFTTFNGGVASGGSGAVSVGAGVFTGATAFDGIVFYPFTGNFTGTIQIFGYND